MNNTIIATTTSSNEEKESEEEEIERQYYYEQIKNDWPAYRKAAKPIEVNINKYRVIMRNIQIGPLEISLDI
jgi:hypothetical protein